MCRTCLVQIFFLFWITVTAPRLLLDCRKCCAMWNNRKLKRRECFLLSWLCFCCWKLSAPSLISMHRFSVGWSVDFNMSCVDDGMSLETMVFLVLNALSLLLAILRRFLKPVSEREVDHKNLSRSRTLKQRAIHLSISGVIQSWQLQL